MYPVMWIMILETNPPETFVEIINEELSVNSVYVEDVLIDIGDDVKSYLSKVIKNMI